MLGGVKADIDLAANARAKRAEDLVKLEKFDYGIEAGIGFNFYFPSFILSPEIKIKRNADGSDSHSQHRIDDRLFVCEVITDIIPNG